MTAGGAPVEGARITSGGFSTTTAANGSYSIRLEPGIRQVGVSREGDVFTSESRIVEITGATAGLNFTGVAMPPVSVTYQAGPGGSILSGASQLVPFGGDAATVTALPAAGFTFLRWTDGLAPATRTDRSVRSALAPMALFSRLYQERETLLRYDFDEVNGTSLLSARPSVGTSSWNRAITRVSTNGGGRLVNTGTTTTTSSNASIGSTLPGGLYELVFHGVSFSNLTGSAADYVGISFRTTATGSELGTSSRDPVWLRVGNLDGHGNSLDAQFGRDSSDVNSASNPATPGIRASNTPSSSLRTSARRRRGGLSRRVAIMRRSFEFTIGDVTLAFFRVVLVETP